MSDTKAIRLEIEDALNAILSGEDLANAQNLVAYLRENRMSPLWSATNAWKVSYKSFTVCFIRLNGAADYHRIKENSWFVQPFIGEYEENSISDEFKEIVWNHQKICPNCGRCALVLDTVFGRKYDYACEKSVSFTNPDAESIECTKKLIELRRNDIKEGKAKKHKYVPMKDR